MYCIELKLCAPGTRKCGIQNVIKEKQKLSFLANTRTHSTELFGVSNDQSKTNINVEFRDFPVSQKHLPITF